MLAQTNMATAHDGGGGAWFKAQNYGYSHMLRGKEVSSHN